MRSMVMVWRSERLKGSSFFSASLPLCPASACCQSQKIRSKKASSESDPFEAFVPPTVARPPACAK